MSLLASILFEVMGIWSKIPWHDVTMSYLVQRLWYRGFVTLSLRQFPTIPYSVNKQPVDFSFSSSHKVQVTQFQLSVVFQVAYLITTPWVATWKVLSIQNEFRESSLIWHLLYALHIILSCSQPSAGLHLVLLLLILKPYRISVAVFQIVHVYRSTIFCNSYDLYVVLVA